MKSNVMQLKEKVEFYRANEIKAHVSIIPKPKFKNGLFVSTLQEKKFYWFLDDQLGIPIRLFLNEIYEITDYREGDNENL